MERPPCGERISPGSFNASRSVSTTRSKHRRPKTEQPPTDDSQFHAGTPCYPQTERIIKFNNNLIGLHRDHDFSKEQQAEILVSFEEQWNKLPCCPDRKEQLRIQLFGPQDLKIREITEFINRALAVCKVAKTRFLDGHKTGFPVDLAPYKDPPAETPQVSTGGGGKKYKPNPNPKIDSTQSNPKPTQTENPNPASGKPKKKSVKARCKLCYNCPFEIRDKSKQCHIKLGTCVNKDHPDLAGHDFSFSEFPTLQWD